MNITNLHIGRDCNGPPCTLCDKGATNRALRQSWIAQLGITEEEAEKITPWKGGRPKSPSQRRSQLCVHLGKLTGERVACKECPGTKPLHTCAVHGRCTITRNTEGVPFCLGGCDSFQSREATPATESMLPLSRLTHATRNSGVLIHYAHGLGDFVMLGYITAQLDKSNRYFVVGGGTGCPSIFEGHPSVTPLYPTINNATMVSGGGVEFHSNEQTLATLRAANVTHVFHGLPELWGSVPPPLHSKPRRRLLGLIADLGCLRGTLPNDIPATVPREYERLVEERLRAAGLTPGRKLCAIGRDGVTHSKKDWRGTDANEFVRLLRAKDDRWLTLSFDHPNRRKRGLGGVHGTITSEAVLAGIPFGIAIRALFKFTDLFVGVPSGPWCVSCLFGNFPTVGLWRSLWPSWYMEPKTQGVNLIAASVRKQQFDRLPGSVTEIGGVAYPIVHVEALTGQAVFEQAEKWL